MPPSFSRSPSPEPTGNGPGGLAGKISVASDSYCKNGRLVSDAIATQHHAQTRIPVQLLPIPRSPLRSLLYGSSIWTNGRDLP
ncbi:MAG: hypothetical protein ACRCU2_01065 [Planktothrix sp.]